MADAKGRLTVEEAAEILGDVSANYVGDLAKKGRIRGEKVTENGVRRWRLDPASVDDFRGEWNERRRRRFNIGGGKRRKQREERQEPTEWKIVRLPPATQPKPAPPKPHEAELPLTPKGLVTEDALAAAAGRHVSTIDRAVRAGELTPAKRATSTKGTTTYFFTVEECRRWLRARRRLAEAWTQGEEAYRKAREEVLTR